MIKLSSTKQYENLEEMSVEIVRLDISSIIQCPKYLNNYNKFQNFDFCSRLTNDGSLCSRIAYAINSKSSANILDFRCQFCYDIDTGNQALKSRNSQVNNQDNKNNEVNKDFLEFLHATTLPLNNSGSTTSDSNISPILDNNTSSAILNSVSSINSNTSNENKNSENIKSENSSADTNSQKMESEKKVLPLKAILLNEQSLHLIEEYEDEGDCFEG